MSSASASAPITPTKVAKVAIAPGAPIKAAKAPRTPTKVAKVAIAPGAPRKAPSKIAHCSQLPRIQTLGFSEKLFEKISKEENQYLYDTVLIGRMMESFYTTSDQKSRYEAVQSNMVSVNYVGDFTFDLMFKMMNIREHVDERMAMEIARFVQLYLPQRTFTKIPITINSVDAEGNPVTKILEVKLYYAYEADAVQWLIKAFFNKSDLIDESHRQMNATTTPFAVLNELKDVNPMIQTIFFGDDDVANQHNHLTFQSEMMNVHFPLTVDIFRPTLQMIGEYHIYACYGIYTMYIERFIPVIPVITHSS